VGKERRLKRLKEENRSLKQLVADQLRTLIHNKCGIDTTRHGSNRSRSTEAGESDSQDRGIAHFRGGTGVACHRLATLPPCFI